MVLKDPRSADRELVATSRDVVASRLVGPETAAPSMVRKVSFGGRDWSLAYYAKTNAVMRAKQTAAIVAAIGLLDRHHLRAVRLRRLTICGFPRDQVESASSAG